MALTYNSVLRQAALIVNALDATTPAQLEAAYATLPLTSAIVDNSAVYPFTALKDKMLSAQEALILTIAATAGHPWRELFAGVTVGLAHGDRIPSTSSSGAQIVGVYGAIRDSSDNTPCTRNELEQIRDRVANPNTMWLIPVYWWAMDDGRVYHTRTEVVMDVCVYTRPVADTLNLSSNVLVPDVLAPALVAGTVAECVRDDENVQQAAFYAAKLEAWIAAIKTGLTMVQPKFPAITEKASS